VVNYADYRLVYVAVSAGQKIFGFRKKTLLREKLTPFINIAQKLESFSLTKEIGAVPV